MEKEKQLTFIDEEGNEILCEILFTFESEEFNKSYVLFYPVADAEGEDIEVMAAAYSPTENGEGELLPIETDEEWDLIEDVLAQFDEEEDDDCGCGHDHDHDHDHDDEEEGCKKDDPEHHCGCGHKH